MNVEGASEWTSAHFEAHDLLSRVLDAVRTHGYNPSQHISYDGSRNHIVLDADILERHPEIDELYQTYVDACQSRNLALDQIQAAPKQKLRHL